MRRETIVTAMLFSGTFRGRTFTVAYTRKDGRWTATADWLQHDDKPPGHRVLEHKGRCPCMTDALRVMMLVSGESKPKLCDCRRTNCLICSKRRLDEMTRRNARKSGLRVFSSGKGA